MEELNIRIHDDSNGLDYVLAGDYYIPDLKLPEESRPIGRWGRIHRAFLKEHRPGRMNCFCQGHSGRILPTWMSRPLTVWRVLSRSCRRLTASPRIGKPMTRLPGSKP